MEENKAKRRLKAITRKKRSSEPFWKKSAELKSIGEHFGKAADNMKLTDWFDLAVMGALAYLGYKKAGKTFGPSSLLIGPVSYRLATTMGGTPPVSQIAGLIGLGILGFWWLGSGPTRADIEYQEKIHQPVEEVKKTLREQLGREPTPAEILASPEFAAKYAEWAKLGYPSPF